MGSRCVTGRLLLVVVRPDRNVDAPVDGGGRSLTDCVARLVSAPILARSWTPSVARVTAPASSILRDPHEKAKPFGSRGEKVSNTIVQSFACRPSREPAPILQPSVSQSVSFFTVPPRAHPSTGSQSGSATPGQTQVPSTRSRGPPAINRLSNPPELPNYSIHTLPLTSYTRTSYMYTAQHGCLSPGGTSGDCQGAG